MPTHRYRVTGRVQGVGFRYATLNTARRLDIDGWVRNLPDGNVEVVARGSSEILAVLEDFLERGPFGARVDGVKMEIPDHIDVERGFQVRY